MSLARILLAVVLIWISPVFASPYTEFQKVSEGCPNTEFITVLNRWLTYSGEYRQAILWSRTCLQHPESMAPVLRKLKEQVFKFENQPDIESYARLMAESRMKSRINRAWSVFRSLEADKRHYGPEDRARLNRIPARLEDVALAKGGDAHRSLCAVELDEDAIVSNSAEESAAWERFVAVKADKSISEKHRLLSQEIEACLVAIYRDPSYGRDPFVNKLMVRYADTCDWARRAGLVIKPGVTMRPPGTVDRNVIAAVKAMRDDCADELYRRFQESEKLPKPDQMRLLNND